MEDILTEHESTVHFATTNLCKFKEASSIAAQYGIRLRRLAIQKHEIQAESLSTIVSVAAREFIKNNAAHAVVTDDSGFFINSLKGFPGPYSSFVFQTIGIKGILKLLDNASSRKASFQTAVAYCEPRQEPVSFTGMVEGTVALKSRGHFGFGYDPIFIPKLGDGRTFGEMTMDQKNCLSHRSRAFSSFCRWYDTRKSTKRS